MILNSNSYFSIGSSHKTNQDYALNGTDERSNAEFAVVCDGCSGSKHSDIGSRVLAHASKNSLYTAMDSESVFAQEILYEGREVQDSLNLPNEYLDATLFHLCIDTDSKRFIFDKYKINAYGDGSILKITKNNQIEFTYIEYPSGAPLYMNYYNNPKRFQLYKEKYGVKRIIHNYKLIDGIVSDYQTSIDEIGNSFIDEGIATDYKFIGVTSDGISSFIGSDKKLIEVTLVVKELLNFKSYKGEFIQRRMNGFNKYCLDQGWKHSDDFSIAGIHIDA